MDVKKLMTEFPDKDGKGSA